MKPSDNCFDTWAGSAENSRKAKGKCAGLIICSEPDMKMRYALDGQRDIQCMTYQVSFT